VGMVGGQQFIGVTSGCSIGSAIHEIGHAFGLQHEQSRSDRDAFVTVLFDNIDKRFASNFNVASNSFNGGYYDYDSIMHYPVTGFGRNFGDTIATVPPGIPIGQRTRLSAGDIDAISRVYGLIPTTTTITTTPAGLPVTVDGQTMTAPQAFDWAPGSQHTISVAEAQGTSPRYRFARWSDGGAATHTITASQTTTVFCAQFQRQYPVQAGVASGDGAVSIVPALEDGYLGDRQAFRVTATPAAGSKFVRWTGATFLGNVGSSVSAESPRVQVAGGASNYQATFTSTPLHVVDSMPRGAQVSVDGVTYFTPVSLAWAPGSTHVLNTLSPQLRGNSTHRFTFREWEDGSAGVRQVTATEEGATYTAKFLEEYLLSRSTVGGGTIQVSPPSPEGFYEAGSTVSLTALPGVGGTLRYWVGDLAGNSPTQDVVMDQQRSVLANFGSAFPWLMYHAASFQLNHVPGTSNMIAAPGEIVSIFGENIGPASAQSPPPGTDGRLPTAVGGVSVTFDNVAAPITFAAPNQINVIVPYAVSGRTATTIVVRGGPRGNLTNTVSVLETFPGLFTYDGSGKGPVAALNQDGSVNSESNPAAPGSVVVLYGTGAGVLQESFADGQVIGSVLVAPRAPVHVRFDRLAGQVQFAGAAPFLVNGALQVNVVVPRDVVGGGQVPVRLVVGSNSSPPGSTIWVR
jgi:uncharacterized protein (TIGR03437 family)